MVVSPEPGGKAGGTERFCDQLSDVLAKLGFEVSTVGPRPAPLVLARHGGAALWQAGSVRRTGGAVHPDLVVTTGFLGWPGGWGGRRVHVFVGNMVRQARNIGGTWHWRLRWGLDRGLAEAISARGAVVVAGSAQAAEDARRLYRARVDAVVPLGVDTDVFRPRHRAEARRRLGLRPDARYALFVGRGERGKGPSVAVDACRRAGFDLLAAGTRPVDGSVRLGVLPPQELAWAYAAADAVVLPTAYEGFGFVAVEALACGVPIVTTPTGWARELGQAVPAYRPWLVPPAAPTVATALASVGSEAARAATEAAREHVLEHNTLTAFEHRWADLLTSIGALS